MNEQPGGPAGSPSGGDRSGRGGRAGRDLVAAIGVGAVLVAVLLAVLFVVKVAFVGLVVVAVVVGVYEFSIALRGAGGGVDPVAGTPGDRGIRLPLVPLLAGTAAMPIGAYFLGEPGLVAILGVTLLLTAVWRLRRGAEGFVRDVTATGFVTLYVPFLAGFAVLLLRPEDGPERVLTFVAVAVASDVGGYAAGVLLGRHPMAPVISPKKSWEGFCGSTLCCCGIGVAAVVFLLDGPWWVGLVLGAVAVITATSGDLVESMLKRDLGIKDMGTVLPGHGGVMDRLDSLLPTAVTTWLVLSLLLPMAG